MEHSTSRSSARFRANQKIYGFEKCTVQLANYSSFATRNSGFDAISLLDRRIETVRAKVPVFRPEPKNY